MVPTFVALMRNYISGSLAVENLLNFFNTASDPDSLYLTIMAHRIEENHRVPICKGLNISDSSLIDYDNGTVDCFKRFKLIHLVITNFWFGHCKVSDFL